jgi:broad specificity phosphatase PhoE
MTTLHFVRHGETDWNRQGRFQGTQDIPLNDEGRRQARHLAQVWDDGAEVLVASPLARARETAEILGQRLGLPLAATDDRLVERDYGLASGLTIEERRQRFPDGVIPGVEDVTSMHARARRFLDAVTSDHGGRRVVAVSHGGFINAVLSLVSGGEVGTGKSVLVNASVSTLIHRPEGWSVTAVGRTPGTPST